MQGFMHVFMCVYIERALCSSTSTNLLCARMGLDGSGRAISAGKLLRQMDKQRVGTEGALQYAVMRAVGQGTSDSACAALPQ